MAETVIAEKACNFLVPGAQPDLAFYTKAAGPVRGQILQAELMAVLEGFRAVYGGLWIGGRATLTDESLGLAPNGLNRALHKSDYSMAIPLCEIVELTWEFGFVSGIVRVRTARGTVKLRCMDAKGFLATIGRTRATFV